MLPHAIEIYRTHTIIGGVCCNSRENEKNNETLHGKLCRDTLLLISPEIY
jgi:hypothetical protein